MQDAHLPTHAEPASSPVQGFLQHFWQALDGDTALLECVEFTGQGSLPSAFCVTDIASASLGVAGLAVAQMLAGLSGNVPAVQVDRRLASFWFASSLRPIAWPAPPKWDAIAGDYRTRDGWIRLHTNAPHHRDAALAVLGVGGERSAVAAAVLGWRAEELETAVVARGGVAAEMRTMAAWRAHPQGQAVHAEPLLAVARTDSGRSDWLGGATLERPLRNVRVLDLTRVLAGPTATRFLAGYGADVLRIDPPWWNEPALEAEVTPGKRCARLDLSDTQDRKRFEELLSQADVLVHGYRSDALAGLGLDAAQRRRIRPGLIDVSLDAYGWTGPWRARRGFDSLLQMSSGLADEGMKHFGKDTPTPLPVQALDYATGYLMAAAAVRGLTQRALTGEGCEVRTSLAAMAAVLAAGPRQQATADLLPETPEDQAAHIEQTVWGQARRLRPPVSVAGAPMSWDTPAEPLGSSAAAWSHHDD